MVRPETRETVQELGRGWGGGGYLKPPPKKAFYMVNYTCGYPNKTSGLESTDCGPAYLGKHNGPCEIFPIFMVTFKENSHKYKINLQTN